MFMAVLKNGSSCVSIGFFVVVVIDYHQWIIAQNFKTNKRVIGSIYFNAAGCLIN